MARGVPGSSSSEGDQAEAKKLAVGKVANDENKYLAHEILKEVHRLTKMSTNTGKQEYLARNMNTALESIKKHPLPILSGDKAKELEGIGKVTAKMIDDILERKRKQPPPSTSSQPPAGASGGASRPQQQEAAPQPPKVHQVSAENVQVEEEGGEDAAAPKAKRARTVHAVGIRELVAAGRLQAGQALRLRKQDRARGRDVEEEGIVGQEGTINYRGNAYKTPNAFANAAWLSGGGLGKVTDGWGCVYAGGTTLKYLRQKFEEEGGGACPASSQSAPAAAPKARQKKDWLPGVDTCGRALLVGLYRKKYGIGCAALGDEGVGKEELGKFSEQWCTASILKPAGGVAGARTFGDRGGAEHVNWITGWQVMKSKMEPEGIVEVKGHPKKFWSLTEKGEELARRMHLDQLAKDTGQAPPQHPPSAPQSSSQQVQEAPQPQGQQAPAPPPIRRKHDSPRDDHGKQLRKSSMRYGSDSDQEGEPYPVPPRRHHPAPPASPPPRSDSNDDILIIDDSPAKKVSARDDAKGHHLQAPECEHGTVCYRNIFSQTGAAHFASCRHPQDHRYAHLLGADGLLEKREPPRCPDAESSRGIGGCEVRADEELARILQREEEEALERDHGARGSSVGGAGQIMGLRDVFGRESSAGVARSMVGMMEAISSGAPPAAGVAAGAGSWRVVLIVDSSEPKDLLGMLSAWDVSCEQRGLHGGDYVWIAREEGSGREVVLDYILERKRVDDFVDSMVGKRYVSQKHRMTECGITNKIYLVEGDPRAANLKLLPQGCDDHEGGHKTWEDRIRSATIETEVMHKFVSVKTEDLKGTAMLLWRLTNQIEALVNEQGVGSGSALMSSGSVMSYASFQDKMKHLKHDMTLNDMHQIMLSTIKGLGAKTAEVLSQEFSTPAEFYDCVSKCSSLSDFGSKLAEVCTKDLTPKSAAQVQSSVQGGSRALVVGMGQWVSAYFRGLRG